MKPSFESVELRIDDDFDARSVKSISVASHAGATPVVVDEHAALTQAQFDAIAATLPARELQRLSAWLYSHARNMRDTPGDSWCEYMAGRLQCYAAQYSAGARERAHLY